MPEKLVSDEGDREEGVYGKNDHTNHLLTTSKQTIHPLFGHFNLESHKLAPKWCHWLSSGSAFSTLKRAVAGSIPRKWETLFVLSKVSSRGRTSPDHHTDSESLPYTTTAPNDTNISTQARIGMQITQTRDSPRKSWAWEARPDSDSKSGRGR